MEALLSAGADITEHGDSVTVAKKTLKAFEFDASECPDIFPALAVLAAYCEGTTTIKGTSRLTYKESDRASTIAQELGKLGVSIDISTENLMVIHGPLEKHNDDTPAVVSSHNDHRIAMAAATVAIGLEQSVEIEKAEAVDKSYPAFWDDLELVTKTGNRKV